MKNRSWLTASASVALLIGLSACYGDGGNGGFAGTPLGRDQVDGGISPSDGGKQPVPTPTVTPTSTGTPGPEGLGASCHSDDPNRYCLSLKYVVYSQPGSDPVVSSDEVLANIQTINSIWSACNIAFEVGKYAPLNPSNYGLNFNTSSSGELTSIREAFEENDTLLVVTTGAWSGSLGSGSANAWTNLPGSGTYGVVLEEPVGNFGPIVAHELGHYLNLGHASSTTNVMSAIIYGDSTGLTASQCSAAREAVQSYWQAMKR